MSLFSNTFRVLANYFCYSTRFRCQIVYLTVPKIHNLLISIGFFQTRRWYRFAKLPHLAETLHNFAVPKQETHKMLKIPIACRNDCSVSNFNEPPQFPRQTTFRLLKQFLRIKKRIQVNDSRLSLLNFARKRRNDRKLYCSYCLTFIVFDSTSSYIEMCVNEHFYDFYI